MANIIYMASHHNEINCALIACPVEMHVIAQLILWLSDELVLF